LNIPWQWDAQRLDSVRLKATGAVTSRVNKAEDILRLSTDCVRKKVRVNRFCRYKCLAVLAEADFASCDSNAKLVHEAHAAHYEDCCALRNKPSSIGRS